MIARLVALFVIASASFGAINFNVTNLKYFKNYFLTGDYATGGVGMAATGSGGTAKANITVDGIPANAEILAAYLYWETLGTGAAGKFNGKAIAGTSLGQVASPCLVPSKVTVYRADVLQFLKVSGDTYDGKGPYAVELPDSGNISTAPVTLGASLVVIWRLVGRPYRGIVLFDGAFTVRPPNFSFNTNLAGFYQAATANAVRKARMTHIVGGGQANVKSNLYFNGKVLEATGAFKGALGKHWDTLEYDVTADVPANASSASTSSDAKALPPGGGDCLTWAAIAFSTTVQDADKDGLLDTWEDNGFRDMERTTSQATAPMLDLKAMGADKAKRDLFIEIDWMKAADHDHKPVAGALTDFTKAFGDQNIIVHTDIGQSALFNGGEELAEQASVGMKGGLESIKNANGPAGRRNFQDNRRFIFHYSLWAHKYSLKNKDGVESDTESCGIADLPGGDTIMAFANFTGKVGNRQEQVGCFCMNSDTT